MKALAEEIVHGRRLKREDGLQMFLTADLQDLCEGADRLRTHFNGNRVNLCTIINGKSGRCSEDCKFCNQSSFYDTACEVHGFLEPSDILAEAKGNEAEGVDRFAIVTACRKLQGKEFANALRAFRMMHEGTALGLCASMGLLNREQFRELKDAGVSRYHINPEADLRFAAGRSLCENAGEHAFQSGFSAAITGNMLTTTGSTIQSDRQMLSELGRELV